MPKLPILSGRDLIEILWQVRLLQNSSKYVPPSPQAGGSLLVLLQLPLTF